MKTCPLNMYGYGVRCVLLLASSPGCSSVYTKVLLMVLLFCLFWVFLNFEAFANNFPIRSLIFILCTVFFFCCTPAHFWSGVFGFSEAISCWRTRADPNGGDESWGTHNITSVILLHHKNQVDELESSSLK